MKTTLSLLTFVALSIQAVSKPQRPTPQLREVIVSHTDDNGILQLFRMKEDGADSVQLMHSDKGCRMPAVSPDGKKLIYVQQIDHSLSLWLSDIDGKNLRPLINDGMNLLPSWLPDSRQVVWMKAQRGKKGQPKQDLYLAQGIQSSPPWRALPASLAGQTWLRVRRHHRP